MGLFLEKSVIIEFNGLPATGKTTIANALVEKLQQDNIPCIRNFIRFKWQRNGRTVLLSPRLLLLLFRLHRFANGIKPRKNRITHILGEMFHCRSYMDFLRTTKEKKVLVVDQGLIQSIISIANLDKIEDKASLNKIVDFYKKNKIAFISVDCVVDPQLSYERIKDRPDNTARMHRVPRNELLNAMKRQADNFAIVRDCFSQKLSIKTISIDTESDPIENASIIINRLITDGYISD